MNNAALIILGVVAVGAIGFVIYLETRPAPAPVRQPSAVEQLIGGLAGTATGIARLV